MHRYVFRMYALNRMVKLPKRPMKESLVNEMQGSILETADLIGTFERPAGKQSLRETG
jgi:phosphatidylethanolamine-binding protein (PEBP) family uncharacterized protein